jgi:HlyD family secretion protein
MDIPRPSAARQKRIRRIIYGTVALLVIALVTVGLSRLKPAAPTVEKSTVYTDTVKRAPMVRQVRGLGVLIPEDIRWIPSVPDGRVEQILVRPGAIVKPDTVLVELSNPQMAQAVLEAETALKVAEANLENQRTTVQNDLLSQQATATIALADYNQAKLQAEADAELGRQGLQSDLQVKLSTTRADQAKSRSDLEKERLARLKESAPIRVAANIAEVERLRAALRLKESQAAQLKVRAGMNGVLQEINVEVGQQVGPGTNIARVADPTHLKAEIKVPETQAKDVQIGQLASIDTRNGLIAGKVSRIDPAVQQGSVTVDVALEGDLPKGARPDLSVDGTIELERLGNVLQVGRPTFGQEDSTIKLFRCEPDGVTYSLTTVTLGRTSVNTVEIKSGLKEGDVVILSDMSQYDQYDRVRVK